MVIDNRLKKEYKIKRQAISRGLIESNVKNEKHLKNLQNTRDFSYDNFNKGKLWYESGLALEDADIELKNDTSFIRGYEHSKRLAFINQSEDIKKR